MYTVYVPCTASFFTQIYFSCSYIFIFTLRSNFGRMPHYVTANGKCIPNETAASVFFFFQGLCALLTWPSPPLRFEVYCRISSKHFCHVFQIFPVTPVVNATVFTLTFHMCRISANQSSCFSTFKLLSQYMFVEMHK